METIFNQFKEQFNGKSLNEILGCAKYSCEGLYLIKDVDEYDNNEFACVVGWYPNDEFNPAERIEVECFYSIMENKVIFTLLHSKVSRFNRMWDIVQKWDFNEHLDKYGEPLYWKVLEMDEGTLYMNNADGDMVFIEKSGRVLKTDF
jgi:hypothetical protein